MASSPIKGMMLVLTASALWAGSGPLTKVMQANGAGVLDILSWRYLVGLGSLGLFWLTRRRGVSLRIERSALKAAGQAALVMLAVNGFFIWSNFYTTVAHAIALSFTAPIFAALLGWLFLRERIQRRHLLAITAGMAGVAILVLQPAPDAPQGLVPAANPMLGNTLALLCGITFGAYFVLARKFALQHGEVIACTFWQFLLMSSILAPVAGWSCWQGISGTNMLYLVVFGVFCTAAPILLINLSGMFLKAHVISLVALFEVPFCIFLGMMLVREYPSLRSWIGVGLIVSASLAAGLKDG